MRFIVLALWLIASPVLSSTYTFELNSVRVQDVIKAVVEDISGDSLVISPEVLDEKRLVSFIVKKVTAEQATRHLIRVLDGLGYGMIKISGVWHVAPSKDPASEVFIYFPQHKSTSYLLDLINGVVPGVKSATARAVQEPVQPVQQSMQQPVQQNRAAQSPGARYENRETGTNVTSMIGKNAKETIVLTVPADKHALVRSLLEQVDIPSPEVEIKAMVVEVQRGKTEVNALDFFASIASGQLGIEFVGGADSKRGVSVSFSSARLLWSAIEKDQRFKVLTSPKLRVKSGAVARFSVGAEVPVLGAVSYQQSGQAVQSVEYKQSGIILDLAPEIRKSRAEISIRQQLSNFVATSTGVNNSPTLLKRELTTVVVAGQGDLILLGGLNESKESDDSAGLFFLPSFLRSKGAENSSTEIVMLLYVEKLGVDI